MQQDNGVTQNWKNALSYCKDLELAGHADWRLPAAKELQSLIDYTRSPATSGSAAIDPVFNSTTIINEAGQEDYGQYWTSTTHVSQFGTGEDADYLCFGRCLGYFNGTWQDVHGAGAQRTDPKDGNPADYPHGSPSAPQGDVVRIFNMVRCVRGPHHSTHIMI